MYQAGEAFRLIWIQAAWADKARDCLFFQYILDAVSC